MVSDLDVAVAEKVMGLRRHPTTPYTWTGKDGRKAFDLTGPHWSVDLAPALRVFDRMRSLGHRWLLNADQEGFHLRRVAWVAHDGQRDEKTYTVDKPLGSAKTLDELAKLICEAALKELGVHEPQKGEE